MANNGKSEVVEQCSSGEEEEVEKSNNKGEVEVEDMTAMELTIEIDQEKWIPLSFSKEQGIPSKPKDGESNIGVPEKSLSFEPCYIKQTFTLMDIEHHEISSESMDERVDYKINHLQNHHLQLDLSKHKHTYSDDDVNVLSDTDDAHHTESRGILSDSSDNKLSSCDEESPEGEPVAPSKSEEKSEEAPLAKPTLPPEICRNTKLKKYWYRRFSLFSKFDQGIRLDEESWYSVTPEQVAKQAAERCRCDVIVDAFCGAGGNTIQFALTCNRVIAIDIDPKKIDIAYNNAKIYGVANKIEFIVGDFLQLSDSLKADVVFLSPPWGGPEYLSAPVYDLEENLQPVPLSQLLAAARKISPNIAAFLPRNCDTSPLMKEAGVGGRVEIEQEFIDMLGSDKKKLIAVTAYYNDLIKDN